jgi:hypothetical protein
MPGFQLVGRQFLDLLDQCNAGFLDRWQTERDGARPAGAAAFAHPVRVALNDLDILNVDAELLRNDLAVGCRMALTVGLGSDQKGQIAVRADLDGRFFPAWKGTGLNVGANAEAADTCRRPDLPAGAP